MIIFDSYSRIEMVGDRRQVRHGQPPQVTKAAMDCSLKRRRLRSRGVPGALQ